MVVAGLDTDFEDNSVDLFVGNHNHHIVVDMDDQIADIHLDVRLGYNLHMIVPEVDSKILLVVVENCVGILEAGSVDKVFDMEIATCYHRFFLHLDIEDCQDKIVVVDSYLSLHKEHSILGLNSTHF